MRWKRLKIAENICNMLGEHLFPTHSGTDTNHSDTSGSRGISKGHLKISIISLKRKIQKRSEEQKYCVGSKFLFQVFHSSLWSNFQSSLKHVENITIPLTKEIKIWDDWLPCPGPQMSMEKQEPKLTLGVKRQAFLCSLCILNSTAFWSGITRQVIWCTDRTL